MSEMKFCEYCWDMGQRAAKAKRHGLIFHCDPCPTCDVAPPSSAGNVEEGLYGDKEKPNGTEP